MSEPQNISSAEGLPHGLIAGVDPYGPTATPPAPSTGSPDASWPGAEPTSATTRVCVLTEFGLISATGPEARTFLNGQLTNDVLKLAENSVQLDGYCTAKGRLLASFIEWPVADGIHLAVAADLATPIAKRLSMFVLRAKLKIADVSAHHIALGIQGAGVAVALGQLGLEAPRPWTLSRAPTGVALGLPDRSAEWPRAMVWIPRSELDSALSVLGLPIVSSQGWRDADIQAGLPRIVRSSSELFVPQMVNFDLIGAVNFKKGCYPGQEVVARSQYLGKLKRRMFKARAQSLAAPGDDVLATGSTEPVGKVVMAARSHDLPGLGSVVAPAGAAHALSGASTPPSSVSMLVELQTAAALGVELRVNGTIIELEALPYEVPIGG